MGYAPACLDVAITIAVANASGTSIAAPTGTVRILAVDNAALTGTNTATLSGGSATFTVNTSTLSSGGHTISAIYLGDGNYAASKGSLYVDVVSSSQKDFGPHLLCTAPSAATSGSSASGIAFTITPANGFTGTVNLTASVDSTVAASYTFSPATITVSSGSPVTANLALTGFPELHKRRFPHRTKFVSGIAHRAMVHRRLWSLPGPALTPSCPATPPPPGRSARLASLRGRDFNIGSLRVGTSLSSSNGSGWHFTYH